MRVLLSFLFLISGCDLLNRKEPPATQIQCPSAAPPVGRYQLFQGTVRATYKDSEQEEPVIFRLDTQTGKVSAYRKYYNSEADKIREFWTVEAD